MAVNCPQPTGLRAVPGVKLATAAAAIKSQDRDDIAVLLLAPGTQVSGVFTQSHFKAPPVQICQQVLAARQPVGALVINSGNANAATGAAGLADARRVCQTVQEAFAVDGSVLPFSTGVIGERLPVAAMADALRSAATAAAPAEDAWLAAAKAIMTTDTLPKAVSRTVLLDGVAVTMTGMAKGSGMINPNMATMLGYVACDAQVDAQLLDRLCRQVADASFNRITVDGDTSTNDAFMLLATGQADNPILAQADDSRYATLRTALTEIAVELAQRVVRDGEGATKFVTITTRGAVSAADALAVSRTIADSPLVKTALFAGDANWGRLCMAIGRAPATVDPERVVLLIDDHCIARQGMVAQDYDEAVATALMAKDEVLITCDLGLGDAVETVWTCDFSYDYVRINAEYRT